MQVTREDAHAHQGSASAGEGQAAADCHPMDLALAAARRAAQLGEVPVGAVVVWRGRAIAVAHNLRELGHDPLAHAEVLALRRAARWLGRWRLSGCTLFATLEPCPMCAGALVNARVDRLVYAAADARAGAAGSVMNLVAHPALNHAVAISAGLRAAESAALLKAFFRARRSGPGARLARPAKDL